MAIVVLVVVIFLFDSLRKKRSVLLNKVRCCMFKKSGGHWLKIVC